MIIPREVVIQESEDKNVTAAQHILPSQLWSIVCVWQERITFHPGNDDIASVLVINVLLYIGQFSRYPSALMELVLTKDLRLRDSTNIVRLASLMFIWTTLSMVLMVDLTLKTIFLMLKRLAPAGIHLRVHRQQE